MVQGRPGIDISPGYWRNEPATREAFTSDGLRTGDYAHRDAAGYHYFHGRRSDILKVGGENVSTVEIEGVLAGHPARSRGRSRRRAARDAGRGAGGAMSSSSRD